MSDTTDTTVVVLEDLRQQLKDKKISKKQYNDTFTPGTKFFVRNTGSYGTVLDRTTPEGKKLAELTCTLGGPNHVRAQSDWHQCGVSQEMKKTAKKSTKGASPAETVEAAEAVRSELEAQLAKAQKVAGISVVEAVAS